MITCAAGNTPRKTDVQATLTAAERQTVDNIVRDVLRADNVPAVSIALVRSGRLAYAQAYGAARLPDTAGGHAVPGIAATTATRFAIGSVSKQFTAAAILSLSDSLKLSLDDTIGKYLPTAGHADQITIRKMLSHTSGYRDYLTQEYIPAAMREPTTPDAILRTWTKIPLDFSPGSTWQYSNTNYVALGRIIEQVTGQPYLTYLTTHVLHPVGIVDAVSVDRAGTGAPDATGYDRYAIGPPHPAPPGGANWLFAAADLAMTAQDVANWDISLMDRRLLSASAYRAMETEVQTNGGKSTGYGLGIFIDKVTDAKGQQHLLLHHPGEAWGFRSHNFVVPDEKVALVILTNAEYSNATIEIARKLQGLLGLASAPPKPVAPLPVAREANENTVEKRARRIVLALAQGRIEQSTFAPDALSAFTPTAMEDIRRSLASLGSLQRVTLVSTQYRGGMTHQALRLTYTSRNLQVAEYDLPSGKINQFLIDDDDR